MTQDEMRNCPQCGSENPADASDCIACGASLGGESAASVTPPCVNQVAIWSFTLGMLASVTRTVIAYTPAESQSLWPFEAIASGFIVLGPLALVLGLVALAKIAERHGRERGKELALGGMVLGVLGTAVSPYLLLLYLPLAGLAFPVWLLVRLRTRGAARREVCAVITADETAPRLPLSGLALASVALAALGLVTVGLTAILSLPIGIVAMVQLAARKGQLRGWPLAIGGTACAALLLGWSVYGLWTHESVAARKSACLVNVKRIADALSMYASDYGAFPPPQQWESRLLEEGYVQDSDKYVCPDAPKLRSGYAYNAALAGVSPDALGEAWRVIAVFESDRGWDAAGGKELLTSIPRHMKGDNIGFADGHVRWCLHKALLSEDSAEYFIWHPVALPDPVTK